MNVVSVYEGSDLAFGDVQIAADFSCEEIVDLGMTGDR